MGHDIIVKGEIVAAKEEEEGKVAMKDFHGRNWKVKELLWLVRNEVVMTTEYKNKKSRVGKL